jgi:hypothetical protein
MRPDLNRQQIGKIAAGGGLLVALLSVLFGGIVQFLLESTLSVDAIDIIRRGLPIGGLVVIVAVLWKMRTHGKTTRNSDPLVETATTTSVYNSNKVGAEVEQRLENAAIGWYRCEQSYSVAAVQDELETNVVRIIKHKYGLDETAAVEAVRSGAWTDDRVAGAFLSTQIPQPVTERLRGALDPGTAFYRRIERTLSAIEALEGHSSPGSMEVSASQTTIYENSQVGFRTDDTDDDPAKAETATRNQTEVAES